MAWMVVPYYEAYRLVFVVDSVSESCLEAAVKRMPAGHTLGAALSKFLQVAVAAPLGAALAREAAGPKFASKGPFKYPGGFVEECLLLKWSQYA